MMSRLERMPAWAYAMAGLMAMSLFVAMRAASGTSQSGFETLGTTRNASEMELLSQGGQTVLGLLPALLPLAVLAVAAIAMRRRSQH